MSLFSNNRLFTVEEVTSNYSGDMAKDDFKFKRGSIMNYSPFTKRLNSDRHLVIPYSMGDKTDSQKLPKDIISIDLENLGKLGSSN